MAETLVLQNATIFDSTGREPYGPGAVVVEGSRIAAVGPSEQVAAPRDARVIEAGGHTVMPGLIDAHTHVGAVDNSFGANFEDNHPGAIYAYSVARILRETLMAGFTTIPGCRRLRLQLQGRRRVRADSGASHFHQPGLHLPDRGHGDMRQRHDRGAPGGPPAGPGTRHLRRRSPGASGGAGATAHRR